MSSFRFCLAATLLASAATLAAAPPAAAQATQAGTRSLGIAGSGIATARGQEALFSNPANLGLAGGPAWSFALPQLALGLHLSGVSLNDLWEARGYDDFSESRRRDFLDGVSADGIAGRFATRQPLASMSMGGFALGVSYANSGEHTLGRDLVELFLEGYEAGRTDYSVAPTRGERTSYWDAAAGYGRRVGPLSVGVAGHYLFSATRARTRLFDPSYDLLAQDLEIDYVGALSRDGRGWGVDVGAAFQATPALTLSATVENAASQMTWGDEVQVRMLSLQRADFEDAAPEDLFERYQQSERTVTDLGAERAAVRATAEGLTEGSTLASRLRVGAAWTPNDATALTVAWEEELSAGALATGWQRATAVGAERSLIGSRARGIVARAGYATDFDGSNLISGGLSLGPVQLAVARTHDAASGAEARDYDGWIVSLGFVARGFVLR